MTRQPVTSTNIRSIGHDGGTLEIEFSSGAIYQYGGVSAEEHQALLGADSIGRHFGQHIRPKFNGVRVETEPHVEA